jgi:type IV pilus assembly protein PilA
MIAPTDEPVSVLSDFQIPPKIGLKFWPCTVDSMEKRVGILDYGKNIRSQFYADPWSESALMQKQSGFTLIELMAVIAFIGILAAISVPQFSIYRDRAYRGEGYALGGALREDVSAYYDEIGVLPKDNADLGLPRPESIRGKYVAAASIHNGEVTLRYDDKLKSPIAGKTIRLIPHVNTDYPTGPLQWEWIWPADRPSNSGG